MDQNAYISPAIAEGEEERLEEQYGLRLRTQSGTRNDIAP